MLRTITLAAFAVHLIVTQAQDGLQIAYFSVRDSFPDVYLMTIGEEATARRLTNSKPTEYGFAWSPDGRLLGYTVHVKEGTHAEVLDLERDSVVWSSPRDLRIADWSPDGRWVLMQRPDERDKQQVWRMAWPSGELEVLTAAPNTSMAPRYAPDGKRIIFTRVLPAVDSTVHANAGELVVLDTETGQEKTLTSSARFDALASWSPDGQWIAYHSCDMAGCHLRLMKSDGSNDRELVRDAYDNRWPEWSRDGQWIAYTSVRDGDTQLVLVRPDGSGMRSITSNPGRDEIGVWRPR